jgi:hypothetical protein
MEIVSQWLDSDRTILHTRCGAHWSWPDLIDHDREVIVDLLASVDHTVTFILDLDNRSWLPLDRFMANIRHAPYMHDNRDFDCVIFTRCAPEIGHLLVRAHRSIEGENRRYRFARTLDEARGLIATNRART